MRPADSGMAYFNSLTFFDRIRFLPMDNRVNLEYSSVLDTFQQKGRAMERSRSAALLAFLFVGALVGAQSAAYLDGILSAPALSAADAAYLAAASSGAIAESAKPAAAFALAQEKGWLAKGALAEAPVSVQAYAQMLSKAFAVKGSLMYSIFPVPRYAFKHLRAVGVIPSGIDPDARLGGELALNMAAAVSERSMAKAAPVTAEGKK